jgi:hypothetical protein
MMKQVTVACIVGLLILLSASAGCIKARPFPEVTPAPSLAPAPVPPSPAATTNAKCPTGYYWSSGNGGSGQCLQGFISGTLARSVVHQGEPITVKGICEGYPSVTVDVYRISGSSQVPVASQEVTVGTGAAYEVNLPSGGYSPGQYLITVTAAPTVKTKLQVLVDA